MKKYFLFFMGCLFLSALSAQQTEYIPGELIVMMEKGEHPSKLTRELSTELGYRNALSVSRCLSELSNIYLLAFDAAIDAEFVLREVQKMKGVKAAQLNHIVEDRTLPNDPSIGNQWHHVDASDNDIDSDLAWDITTGGTTINGDEIVVCVLEGGGANYNHVDLIANHWTNTAEIPGNGVDDDGNGFIDDVNGWNSGNNSNVIASGGHGTAVSGMIGAKGNNGNGGAGVNWDVKIMQVDMGGLSEATVIAAYNYPYTMRNMYNTTNGATGAFVVATNASWGIDNANPASYPVWCAYYDDLGSVGILNCGATANNNVNIDVVGDMPTGCSSDYMVAVTASNSSDVRTFSGYGQTTIDLAAPGESVFLPSGSTGYSSTSGTSFASPCVAGAIALVYSSPCPELAALALSNPQLAADMVRGYILDGVDLVPNLTTETVTGGRLNVRNAIDLALAGCGPLEPCVPVGLTASSDCSYDALTGTIQASILVDVTMSQAYCNAETVCYQAAGGSVICDDLVSLGVTLNNETTYTLLGLSSNTTYDLYFTTSDGTSSSFSVTTGDCTSEIPGCTNPLASNYNATATFDDGSCTFPCDNLTLTIDTDCWGNEVSWEILDASNNVVASVAGGTYGNQSNFTWSECLEYGCYTFNIFDSFGDGLDGTASGCAVDGNYQMTNGAGDIIFQMGTANYGSGATHAFCFPTDVPGCIDNTACNYSPSATSDDGSCEFVSCAGCTDAAACNFDPTATIDNGTCDFSCLGCIDSGACNFDPVATIDNGTCDFTCFGCIDAAACNFNAGATIDDGSCDFSCFGCIDSGACNFNAGASIDDGSCDYTCVGCTNPAACNYDPTSTIDDGSCESTSCNCAGDFNGDGFRNVADILILLGDFGCIGSCAADMSGDGFVNSSDVLDFLSVFGIDCP
ncbi:MAG: hypothetical protein ACI923_002551 [Flavobacteriales bacterium]|jgi:hypothetical protein